MSTSSNAAQPARSVTAFLYPELPGSTGLASGDSSKNPTGNETEAREAGRMEGEARARASFEQQVEAMRKSVASAIDKFARERLEYFLAVEQEVVQLAFSIARRILRREAQIDPLLLAGMVRVALEQTAQATNVTVRVHPHQVSDFRMYFARHLQDPPEVIEDASLPSDGCVLQTSLGKTEIGPEIQLKEIEQGLLDLRSVQPHTP